MIATCTVCLWIRQCVKLMLHTLCYTLRCVFGNMYRSESVNVQYSRFSVAGCCGAGAALESQNL